MSSKVKKSSRTQREPRKSLSDFSENEQKAIAAVKKWFPGEVCCFGTRVTGQYEDDSDFDFGVVGYRGRRRHAAIHAHLEKMFGMKFDFRNINQVKKRKDFILV